MNQPQNQRREQLYALLGDLPDRAQPLNVTMLDRTERDGYSLETLILALNGVEDVPAYFVKPLNATGRLPCILYNHAHGNQFAIGKRELLDGRDALQRPGYARALTGAGYAALCFDTWCFGERQGRTMDSVFKAMLWRGQVLWGMMVFDSLRAIDYLISRPDVDPARIGTLGISMGSTMAWWVAALDPRVGVCVDLCCLTDFQALLDANGLDEHGAYYYVPSLLKHFSTAQINTLVAPRAHLSLAGNYDPLTPPAGLDRIDQALRQSYKEAGNDNAWQLKRYETGHFETAAMRFAVLEFLKQWL